MTESTGPNPYAAPAAAVADPRLDPGSRTAPFFSVGTTKLAVMSVLTFGLYEIYWAYRHWRTLRDVGGQKVWPVPRSIFFPVVSYSLFHKISDAAQDAEVPATFSPAGLAVAVIAFALSSRLPEPYSLVSLASFLPLLPAQSAANEVNAKIAPLADPNTRFTLANFIWVVVLALLLVAAFAGTFSPEGT